MLLAKAALAAEVRGALSKEQIKAVVGAHRSEIKACYDAALKENDKLEGKVVIWWTVAGDGKVVDAKVKESSLSTPAVESCMVEKIRAWVFPEPKGGGSVEINYPFVLKKS